MDFLKRQLFLIICGVVAAGSIALGFVGMNSMSAITKNMEEARTDASKLPRLQGGPDGPVNGAAIDAQQRRIDAVKSHYEQVLEWARQRNQMKPLLDECFPDPDRDKKRAFRDAYFPVFDRMLEDLRAGTVATQTEIDDAEEQITEEKKSDRFFGVDQPEPEAAEEEAEEEEAQPLQYASGLLTDYGARNNAQARANLIKARGMWCYADLSSFEVFNSLSEKSAPIAPDVNDMWDAQVSLWVQQSVVESLVRVNRRAADALREGDQSPWVGVLPIKELVSIRTSQYVIPDVESKGFSSPAGDGPASPPASAKPVFTHTVSNNLYEVVQFSVKLVVDERHLPLIIDEICKDNFHTLLRIAYEDASTDPSLLVMQGKIYGSEPTIRVVMDFETIFLGELYRDLMPNDIRAALGLPAREE